MDHSLYYQIFRYFEATVQNQSIGQLINDCLNLSNFIITETKNFFNEEGIPIPVGFTDDDVNINAKKLYLDEQIFHFVAHTCKAGLISQGVALVESVRKDVRDFFTETLQKTTSLFNKVIEIGIQEGVYATTPTIEVQQNVEFVESKRYFLQMKKRPLNTIELSNLVENIKTNAIGRSILSGFLQTTQNEEVKGYIRQGIKIADKHIKIFSEELEESNIKPPNIVNSYTTNSTEPVFSDKLIVSLITIFSSIGQSNYATSAASSMRYDLALNFQRLLIEVALYENDGANLLIKNNWLEEPPQIPDRNKLTK